MSDSVSLVVNGEVKHYQPGRVPASISLLLEELALPGDMVVVELNGEIIKRDKYMQQELRDGDTIELVRFVGGG